MNSKKANNPAPIYQFFNDPDNGFYIDPKGNVTVGTTPPEPKDVLRRSIRDIEQEKGIRWQDPTEEMLNDPLFNAIWNTIKSWDINVPEEYEGYCGATGNHARAIFDAIKKNGKRG